MKKMALTLLATIIVISSGAVGDAKAVVISPPSPPVVTMLLSIADQEMTVSNSSGFANLREKPTKSSKLLSRLPEGTKVIVIEKVGGGAWVHVKVGDKVGYIRADLLK